MEQANGEDLVGPYSAVSFAAVYNVIEAFFGFVPELSAKAVPRLVGQLFVVRAIGNLPKALQIADLNLDGKPDLAVANWNDTSLSVLAGKGDGTFQPKADYAAGAAYSPDDVQAADVNLDGKPDLVYTSWSAGAVSVLLGN